MLRHLSQAVALVVVCAAAPPAAAQPKQQPVSVPSITGHRLADARKLLAAAGFRPGKETKLPSGVPGESDSVVRQLPAAQQPVPRGSVVSLWVVAPPARPQPAGGIAVPALIGRPLADAEQQLHIAGLPPGAVSYRDFGTAAPGTIIAQAPSAGTRVPPLTIVELTVARVPTFAMPSLVGRPLTDAQSLIARFGLTLGSVQVAGVEGQPDTVIGQKPTAASPVHRGEHVVLIVGPPIAPLFVPNVLGMPVAGARDSLRRAGLSVGALHGRESDTAVGRVVAQHPDPGATTLRGRRVDLDSAIPRPIVLLGITVAPHNAVLLAGDTLQFSVQGHLSDGTGARVPVTWSVTRGTVDSAGLYMAGSDSGQDYVVAHTADSAFADSALVVVRPPATAVVGPTPAGQTTGAGQTASTTSQTTGVQGNGDAARSPSSSTTSGDSSTGKHSTVVTKVDSTPVAKVAGGDINPPLPNDHHWILWLIALVATWIGAVAVAAANSILRPAPLPFRYTSSAVPPTFGAIAAPGSRGTTLTLVVHTDSGTQRITTAGARLFQEDRDHG